MPAFKQDIRFTHSHDGVRIAYAVCGEGYPLLRPAHWLTNVELDWQTPLFAPLIKRLADHYRYIRFDSRGCGLSDRDATGFSLDHFVADLEAVADANKLERFALLGISGGSPPAIAYAARHPERVSHLVLLGGFARGALVRASTPEERERWTASIRLIELGWGQNNPAFLQLFTSQFFPNASPEIAGSFNELQRTSSSPQQAACIATALGELDVTDALGEVQCPTLVLHSRGDLRVPFEEGRVMAASIPGARLVPFETDNHVPLAHEPSFGMMFEELEGFLPPRAAKHAAIFPALTLRERQILEHIARGLDNAQIAAHLDLAEKTVRNNITAIFDKLAVENRAQAIVRAREAGLGQGRR